MMQAVACTDCLDEWDQVGEDHYQVHKIETMIVIVGGDSKCKKHYRAWRDRNKEVDARNRAEWEARQGTGSSPNQ